MHLKEAKVVTLKLAHNVFGVEISSLCLLIISLELMATLPPMISGGTAQFCPY